MIQIPDEIQSLIDQEMKTGRYADLEDVLRHALVALRAERELHFNDEIIAGIQQGLADSAAGRYKTLAEYDRDFRQRHGIHDA